MPLQIEIEDEDEMMMPDDADENTLPANGDAGMLSDDEAQAADIEELMNAAKQGEDFETQSFFAPVPTGEEPAPDDMGMGGMSEEDKQALLMALQQMG